MSVKKSHSNQPIWNLIILWVFLWAIVYIRVPDKWIGLKDGYYYSLWIKTFINSPGLNDINGTQYVSYPFYWFWTWGQVYRFLGWASPSNIYAITAMASFVFGTLLANWILKKVVSPTISYAMILIFELFFLMTNQVQIWQKPHEHFAFLVSSSCVIYLSKKLFAPHTIPLSELGKIGFLLGFAFGCYTPPVVALAPGFLLYIIVRLKDLNKTSLAVVFATLLATSAPQLFVTLRTLLHFDKAPTPFIYQITEFFPNLWIPVWLLIFTGVIFVFAPKAEMADFAHFVKVMIFSLFLMYLVVQIAYFFDVIINRSDIILISGTIMLLWAPLFHLNLSFLESKAALIATPLLLSILFFSNTTPQFPGADTDFRANAQISEARATNSDLVITSKIYSSNFCGKKIFSNDELRFLPASIACNTPMTLPFNEGNTGPDIDYQPRILSLKSALESNSGQEFNTWLDNTGTQFLALRAVAGQYNFDFLVNKNFPISGTVPFPTFSISEEKLLKFLDSSWKIVLNESGLLLVARN